MDAQEMQYLRNKCTSYQKDLLDVNPHLMLIDFLYDGDALIIDQGEANPEVSPNGHYGPYILTRNGYLQDVNYHYATTHQVYCPFNYVLPRHNYNTNSLWFKSLPD